MGTHKRLAVLRPGSDIADFVDIVSFDMLAGSCGEWLTNGREAAPRSVS